MLAFPIICGIILIIILGIFLSKTKKEKIKVEVLPKAKQPVIIELYPKGTNNNPIKCKVNDVICFKIFGYSDYKKENKVELKDSNIMWHILPKGGAWEKDFGIENNYYAPSTKGYFDVYVKYRDNKLRTSCKSKIIVEA